MLVASCDLTAAWPSWFKNKLEKVKSSHLRSRSSSTLFPFVKHRSLHSFFLYEFDCVRPQAPLASLASCSNSSFSSSSWIYCLDLGFMSRAVISCSQACGTTLRLRRRRKKRKEMQVKQNETQWKIRDAKDDWELNGRHKRLWKNSVIGFISFYFRSWQFILFICFDSGAIQAPWWLKFTC